MIDMQREMANGYNSGKDDRRRRPLEDDENARGVHREILRRWDQRMHRGKARRNG